MNDPGLTAAAVFCANVVNPTLAVAALAGSVGLPRRASWRYVLAGAAGVGIAVLLAESGKRWQVWPGHPWFPSGHETFAAACIGCLVVRDRRVGTAVGAVALPLLGWSLVRAGYHEPVDVVAGAVLGAMVAGGIVRAALGGGGVRSAPLPPVPERTPAPSAERR